MRFTTPRQKTIVIAVLFAVNLVLFFALDAVHSEAGSALLTVAQVVGWYLATRVFRGPGEPLRPIRPWWRMTNRPLLSAVCAVFYGLVALVNVVFACAGHGSLSGWISILGQAVLAWLFTISASRLRGLARAAA